MGEREGREREREGEKEGGRGRVRRGMGERRAQKSALVGKTCKK